MPAIDKYEKIHLRNLKILEKRIRQLYEDALTEIAFKASLQPFTEGVFTLSEYPLLKSQVEEIITKMHGQIYGQAVAGIDASWDLSNKKNDVLVDRRLKGTKRDLSGTAKAIYYDPNIDALKAFKARKSKGLNLSQRVWNLLKPFKKEIEQSLGFMIGEGKSASEVARGLKGYLHEPERLYRRVRGEDGTLRLSKAARDYHPGQGVYRSSYKNAVRLTRTETNIAYRSSDYERWNNIPFVVGIEIRTSNRHPEYDICDKLKGKYPKDFKFSGWHPQCLCNAVAIQMTDEEFSMYQDAILAGEVTDIRSVNMVKDVPAAFDNFIDKNAERIAGWKSKPYWVKDNREYVTLK